jgi:hypothetical protein
MILRYAVALALTGLVLVPLTTAHAMPPLGGGGGAIVLRYHFAPGQHLAYRITATAQVTASATESAALAGGRVIRSTTLVSGLAQERVLSVDATGGATVQVRVSSLSVTATVNGRTTTLALPAVPAETIHIAPDGRQQGTLSAGVMGGLQTTAALPPGPVAPGARWTARGRVALGPVMGVSLPPVQVTSQSVLVSYGPEDGQIVAIIDSMGSVQYAAAVTVSGQPLHLQEMGTTSARTFFGVEAGQIVASQAHEDLHLVLRGRTAQGVAVAVREHIIVQTSTWRIGG